MRIFKRLLILALLIFSQIGQAQQIHYKNLVMEGGGIKGIAYGGALAALEEKGILKNIIRVAGTSAGAIQASLLAIGYTPDEITDIIANTPIEAFNDDGFIAKGTKRLFSEYGWYRGDSFLSTLESLIAKRTGNAHLTFADLHELAKSYPFRDLYVVGANLSSQKTVVFSYESYPNMRIADAVRVSMSIPLYYRALWVNPEGVVIQSPTAEDKCQLFVDGGILMNYPISIFDHTKYMDIYQQEECSIFNYETLGFRLDRQEQIDQEITNGHGIAPYEITDFGSYMSALSSILMRNVSPPHPNDIFRTVYINDLGVGAKVRAVPEEEKLALMKSGKEGVDYFFERLNQGLIRH